ncbi:MAG: nuclear transport factor 2 family protein [bacterium]|nr:nuclear transport factor 2 family protein [bacterium]
MEHLSLETLIAVERQGWDSLCNSTGAEHYGRLMTPDGLMILSNGLVMDRETVMASLSEAQPWESYEFSEERVVSVGEGATALVFRAVATRAGEEPFEALMSSTYVLEGGEPRLALYTQTPVLPAPDHAGD